MRRRQQAVAMGLAMVVLVGCGEDGDEESADEDSSSVADQDEGDEGAFDEPIEVDDLTVTVGEPYRYGFSPEVVRMDVTFETGAEEVPTPNPTLECEGEVFEIDHDSANYAAEVSSDEPEDGEWAWSAGEDCAEGRIEVGDVELSFDEVAARD